MGSKAFTLSELKIALVVVRSLKTTGENVSILEKRAYENIRRTKATASSHNALSFHFLRKALK